MANGPESPEMPDAGWREPPEPPQRVPAAKELPDPGLYREFRVAVASRQWLDSYFAALARALRFTGEVRVEFHDGQVMWSELRETWVDWPAIQEKLGHERSQV